MARKNRKVDNQSPDGTPPLLVDAEQAAALLSIGERARQNRKTKNLPPKGVDPLLLDAKQAAALLSIGERTLWKLVAAGELAKPVAIGRAKRWRYGDVRAYADRLCS